LYYHIGQNVSDFRGTVTPRVPKAEPVNRSHGHFPRLDPSKCSGKQDESISVIGSRYLEKGRREAPQVPEVAFGRVRVFQMATNDIPSELWAQAILKAEQKILEILKMNKGPFMARITLGGNVSQLCGYFEAHRDDDMLT
jgi:hypothetical protein